MRLVEFKWRLSMRSIIFLKHHAIWIGSKQQEQHHAKAHNARRIRYLVWSFLLNHFLWIPTINNFGLFSFSFVLLLFLVQHFYHTHMQFELPVKLLLISSLLNGAIFKTSIIFFWSMLLTRQLQYSLDKINRIIKKIPIIIITNTRRKVMNVIASKQVDQFNNIFF